MANKFRIKRRMTGPAGSPAETGYDVGEILVNATSATDPELWFFGGPTAGTAPNNKGFIRLNPKTTITTQSISLVSSAGADIGAAYTAWAAAAPANKITGNVVVATWGTPAQAYVLTNPAAPGVATSWTSLGGAVSFATTNEITTGSDTTKAINSGQLRGASRSAPTGGAGPAAADANHFLLLDSTGAINPRFVPQPAPAGAGGVGGDVATVVAGVATNMFLTPAGLEMRVAHTPNATPANDANKLPALNASGKIPSGFLSLTGLSFGGALDVTVAYAAPTPAPVNGEFHMVSKAGAVEPTWAAQMLNPPASVAVGDLLFYEAGTVNKWHHIANAVDMSAYVPKAGVTAMTKTARLNFIPDAPAAGAAPATIIDGGANLASVDNLVVDCGSF